MEKWWVGLRGRLGGSLVLQAWQERESLGYRPTHPTNRHPTPLLRRSAVCVSERRRLPVCVRAGRRRNFRETISANGDEALEKGGGGRLEKWWVGLRGRLGGSLVLQAWQERESLGYRPTHSTNRHPTPLLRRSAVCVSERRRLPVCVRAGRRRIFRETISANGDEAVEKGGSGGLEKWWVGLRGRLGGSLVLQAWQERESLGSRPTHPTNRHPTPLLRRSAVCVSERRMLSVCVRAGRRRIFRETISANGDEAVEKGGGGRLEKWWVGLRGRLGGSLARQAWQERESLGSRPTHPTTRHPTPLLRRSAVCVSERRMLSVCVRAGRRRIFRETISANGDEALEKGGGGRLEKWWVGLRGRLGGSLVLQAWQERESLGYRPTHPTNRHPTPLLRRSAVCVSERRMLSVCVRAGRRRIFRETISANGDEAVEKGGGGRLEKWWVGLRGRLGGSLARQAWQERESLGSRPTHPTTRHPTPLLRRSAVCVSERRMLSVCVRAGRRRIFRETISANGDEALEKGGGGRLEKWWVGLRGRLGGSLVRQAWQERESLGSRPTHPTTRHPATPPAVKIFWWRNNRRNHRIFSVALSSPRPGANCNEEARRPILIEMRVREKRAEPFCN